MSLSFCLALFSWYSNSEISGYDLDPSGSKSCQHFWIDHMQLCIQSLLTWSFCVFEIFWFKICRSWPWPLRNTVVHNFLWNLIVHVMGCTTVLLLYIIWHVLIWSLYMALFLDISDPSEHMCFFRVFLKAPYNYFLVCLHNLSILHHFQDILEQYFWIMMTPWWDFQIPVSLFPNLNCQCWLLLQEMSEGDSIAERGWDWN